MSLKRIAALRPRSEPVLFSPVAFSSTTRCQPHRAARSLTQNLVGQDVAEAWRCWDSSASLAACARWLVGFAQCARSTPCTLLTFNCILLRRLLAQARRRRVQQPANERRGARWACKTAIAQTPKTSIRSLDSRDREGGLARSLPHPRPSTRLGDAQRKDTCRTLERARASRAMQREFGTLTVGARRLPPCPRMRRAA